MYPIHEIRQTVLNGLYHTRSVPRCCSYKNQSEETCAFRKHSPKDKSSSVGVRPDAPQQRRETHQLFLFHPVLNPGSWLPSGTCDTHQNRISSLQSAHKNNGTTNALYTLTPHLPRNQEYSRLWLKLNPQGHSDALELSRDWETKDYVGKQAPRCSPNLAKGSWRREDKKGDTEPACQAITTQALPSSLTEREEITPA